MTKCFRYLLRFNAVNYAVSAGFAAVILAGCYITGVPADGRGLFSGYFHMFPAMLLLVALFSGTAYCTSSLNHALSLGARRRDYFWGMQLMILLSTLVYWAMESLFVSLPTLLGWSADFIRLAPKVSIVFPFLLSAVHAIGCVIGKLYIRSRVIASIIVGLSTFLLIMASPFISIMDSSPDLWGDLPWLLPLVCVAVTLLCQWGAYQAVRNATVR